MRYANEQQSLSFSEGSPHDYMQNIENIEL